MVETSKATTPGPWRLVECGGHDRHEVRGPNGTSGELVASDVNGADARLICEAVNQYETLQAHVKALRKALDSIHGVAAGRAPRRRGSKEARLGAIEDLAHSALSATEPPR